MRHLSADERAAARMMPDEVLSMLAGLPVEGAREEIRRFWRGMEQRGYGALEGLGRFFVEGEGDE